MAHKEAGQRKSLRRFLSVRGNKQSGRLLGRPNNLERYFIYAFLLSILAGVVYGVLDQRLYYFVSANLPSSQSAFQIFLHNFRNDIISLLTGGLFGLLSNFITFAAVSGLFAARHVGFLEMALLIAIVFATYGTLEMAGHLIFGLIGFTFLERILWKRKTELRRLNLLVVGTVLMLIAAFVEWVLGVVLGQ